MCRREPSVGAGQHFAAHAIFSLGEHEQFDQAIVYQDRVAHADIIGKAVVIYVH